VTTTNEKGRVMGLRLTTGEHLRRQRIAQAAASDFDQQKTAVGGRSDSGKDDPSHGYMEGTSHGSTR
jgi:hypothetical protein